MKTTSTFLIVGSIVLGTVLPGQVCAQIYKWVDERGVTHYSDEAPAKRKVDIVPDRLSVYTPDPSLTRAPMRPRAEAELSGRIDRLERQLEAERQARQFAAAATEAQAYMAAYEQCLADRRVDCDGYDGYYSYGAPLVVAAFRRRRFHQAGLEPVSGVIAGNVVGPKGFVPGNFNSANSMTTGNHFSSRFRATVPMRRELLPGS